MILVTGATGQLGTAVVNRLLETSAAGKVVALARSEQKATGLREKGVEVRLGDFNDRRSLDRAMQGIEKVFLVSGPEIDRLGQHKNVVDAAKQAGVNYIAYTSVSMKDIQTSFNRTLMDSHFQTEDYIKASGLTYTLLRNTLYMEVIQMFAGEKVFETGIFFPAEGGRVPFALRQELGEAAANVLAGTGHENKTYHLTNTGLYSFEDVAAGLSSLSGKAVSYISPEPDEFEKVMKGMNVPEFLVQMSLAFAADIRAGQFENASSDLERLLGRKPASLMESLEELYGF